MDEQSGPGRTFVRAAGAAAVVAGVAKVASTAYQLATLPVEVSLAFGVFYAATQLAWAAALLAAAAIGVVGGVRWGRAALGVAVATCVVLAAAEVVEPFSAAPAEVVFMIAPVVFGVAAVVAGAAALRGGRWTGWRRSVLLAWGAYCLAVLTPAAALGGELGFWYALPGFDLLVVAVGVAVLQEAATPATSAAPPRRSVAA